MAKQTGTVKFFNPDRGFGFITPANGGDDVFVHISAIKASGLDELYEGSKVEFDTKPSDRKPNKGPVACDITVLA